MVVSRGKRSRKTSDFVQASRSDGNHLRSGRVVYHEEVELVDVGFGGSMWQPTEFAEREEDRS